MDTSTLERHMKVADEFYPDMNITQLGMTVMWLGLIRSAMGHEHAKGTIENYIHPEGLSDDVCKCLDFLEREVMGMKKSRIDIDYWKFGNKGEFRPD